MIVKRVRKPFTSSCEEHGKVRADHNREVKLILFCLYPSFVSMLSFLMHNLDLGSKNR